MPRLSHINPAVVLSACKVIISYLPLIDKEPIVEGLCKKLAAPLATLVSGDAYENIWVVLRGLQLVVKKYPQIFADIKIFFIRYQDPSYVKYEKLNMIFSLINERNHEIVLNELNEYAYDMDPEFTTQTVRCIWKTALKISASLTKVLSILSSVVSNVGEGSGSHFIEEALIGYEQIIRRYPKASNYSQNITAIFQSVGSLSRAEAKVSFLFLLGEYFDVIEDAMTTITEKIERYVGQLLTTAWQRKSCLCSCKH